MLSGVVCVAAAVRCGTVVSVAAFGLLTAFSLVLTDSDRHAAEAVRDTF
jgi:hypothetical protein